MGSSGFLLSGAEVGWGTALTTAAQELFTMDHQPVRVVIAGGGTAGWISAALIAAEHPHTAQVVLVESSDIPIIGVGEGTWPSMRRTLQRVGFPESLLITDCDATFKQGTEFIDWARASSGHRYYHPFSLPTEYASVNLAEYWLLHGGEMAFADFVTPQAGAISAGRAPKHAGTPEYAFQLNYGYHIDATRFAALLARHVRSFPNVSHVVAGVEGVETTPAGDIGALRLDTGEKLPGDLFIDCTGQRALLIGRHFGESLVGLREILPNNRAIAVQVAPAAEPQPLPSTTLSTALSSGWVWDIGLQSRRGVGYVHSSDHIGEDEATAEFQAYISRSTPSVDASSLAYRCLRFEPGYRHRPWVRNCVAVGLSAGFLEPLEASSIALIEQAASFISDHLPREPGMLPLLASRFNRKMNYHWERVVEFLKLHYVLSARDDSAYWRDCRDPAGVPAALAEKLLLWQQQAPWHDDAPRIDELFPSASYQYVLYGMGFRPRYSARGRGSHESAFARADAALRDTRENTRRLLKVLPENRDLLAAIAGSPRGTQGVSAPCHVA